MVVLGAVLEFASPALAQPPAPAVIDAGSGIEVPPADSELAPLTTPLSPSTSSGEITAPFTTEAGAPLDNGTMTAPAEDLRIVLGAQFAQAWQQDREAIWLLRGECRIRQGETELSGRQGVVWRRSENTAAGRRDWITVYLEGDARMTRPGGDVNEPTLLVEMSTTGKMLLETRTRWADKSANQDATYRRGVRRRNQRKSAQTAIPSLVDELQTVQYEPLLLPPGEEPPQRIESVRLQPPAIGLRRVRVFPRSAVPYSVETFESQATTPPEQVWLITGGVNLLVDGVERVTGPVDLSADRIVIWTTMSEGGSFDGEGTVQSSDTPLQVYLEGNIIIRQGNNTVRAQRAFYDARDNRALMLDAELSTRMPQLHGNIRMRANEIRQLSENTYQGSGAWMTTSQFGKPVYRLQASNIFVEPWENDWYFGPPERDPTTGEYIEDPVLWATTTDNTFYYGDLPLFYTPKMSFPTEDPNIPLRNIRVGNDRVFGFQMYTDWNLFKLLGRRRPPNTRLDLHLDYLNKRGFQAGLSGTYGGVGRFGQTEAHEGSGRAYVINDSGLDNLGSDRRDIEFPNSVRGRVNIWDRQWFDDGHYLYTEFSWLSDRNVLEQYDERAYDSDKDYETLISLSRNIDNFGYSATVRPRLYDDFNQSEYLPRGDLYLLSEPLMGDWLNWSTHSYGTYATTEVAGEPFDPNDRFSVLPYEGNLSGEVFMTRHQLDTHFNVGPVKVMPYVMGEATHWGDTYSGDSLNRLYGAAGVRSSLEFWKTFPSVESELFNLNGLAHKVTLFADYSYAQSNQPLSKVPWVNEFDENSQEQFRRRIPFLTFNGPVPDQFDPRFYGVRSGAATAVTAGAHELVDDRNALTFGIQQRLQTKRGPINNQRIVNWMTLDLETTFFPQAERDNFNEPMGLYGARYNWFLGDLTTLTASAYFDTFDDAQRTYNIGIISRRSARGTLYLGYRAVEGAVLKSQIATLSYSYQHSDKWISTLGTAYDLGTQQNLGQSATLTRVGESFLVHLGFNVDATRENVGAMISVEPRFLSMGGGGGPTQLGTLLQGNQTR